jgi:hypothetical protein
MNCEHPDHGNRKVAAIVGYGEPVQWLCLKHYEDVMAEVGARLRALREMLS